MAASWNLGKSNWFLLEKGQVYNSGSLFWVTFTILIIFVSPEIPLCASPKSVSPVVINILTSITIHCCCLVNKSCPALLRFHGLYSLPGSSLHGISQARILEWVAISSSRGSSIARDRTHISCLVGSFLYHWVTWEAITIHNICLFFLGDGNLSSPTSDQTWATCSGSIES